MGKPSPMQAKTDFEPAADPSPEAMAIANNRFAKATGAKSKPLQDRLLQQAANASWLPRGQEAVEGMFATLAALEAVAPMDPVEGMLATQMVGNHEAAMECVRRAMLSEQSFEGRDVNLKHAAKLLQIYARQMEALDKHRGRGQQQITVEHVNVHAGGQAIVGYVQAPAGGSSAVPETPRTLTDQSAELLDLTDLSAAGTSPQKQRVKRRQQ